jgi:hypothetical protein
MDEETQELRTLLLSGKGSRTEMIGPSANHAFSIEMHVTFNGRVDTSVEKVTLHPGPPVASTLFFDRQVSSPTHPALPSSPKPYPYPRSVSDFETPEPSPEKPAKDTTPETTPMPSPHKPLARTETSDKFAQLERLVDSEESSIEASITTSFLEARPATVVNNDLITMDELAESLSQVTPRSTHTQEHHVTVDEETAEQERSRRVALALSKTASSGTTVHLPTITDEQGDVIGDQLETEANITIHDISMIKSPAQGSSEVR